MAMVKFVLQSGVRPVIFMWNVRYMALKTPLIELLQVMLVLQQHEYRRTDFGTPSYTDIL